MIPADTEVRLVPEDDKLRAFLLEKYKLYSELVQFYMKFLISANGFFFAIAGGIFVVVVKDAGEYPRYFVFGLVIPLIISASFLILCVQALDGSKKLARSVDELYMALGMRTGPFGHSINFLLWVLLLMHLIFIVFTANVAIDVLRPHGGA